MDNKTYSQNLAAMAKQIKYLGAHGFPSLCNDYCEIVKLNNFMRWQDKDDDYVPESTSEYGMVGEKLQVKIPFAGTNFSVSLFFNLYEPWVPPDMLFSDSKFMKKLLLEDLDSLVPSLNNWSFLSEEIVAQLVLQLYHLYKRYQLECLQDEEILNFEYSSLLTSLNIKEEDTEISLSGGSNWLASLLIRLPLDLKDVPPILIDANPGPLICLLHVVIKKSNNNFVPKLLLSPQVEALIGSAATLALPTVPAGTSLSDYVVNILNLLDGRVKSMVLCFEVRKQLIAQLLCCHGTSILEYDAEKFEKISFLLDWCDFNFILIIELADSFPKTPLNLTLRSIYHLVDNQPFAKVIPDVKMSSDSSPEEMVKIIQKTVIEYLPTFQKASVSVASK